MVVNEDFERLEQKTGVPSFSFKDCPEVLNIGTLDVTHSVEDAARLYMPVGSFPIGVGTKKAMIAATRRILDGVSSPVEDCLALVGFNSDTSYGPHGLRNMMIKEQQSTSEDGLPVTSVSMGIGYFRDQLAYDAHVDRLKRKAAEDVSWMEMDASTPVVHEFHANEDIDIFIQKEKPFDSYGDKKANQFESIYRQFEKMIFPDHGNWYTWVHSVWVVDHCPRGIVCDDYIGFTTMLDGMYVHYYLKVHRVAGAYLGIVPPSPKDAV